MTKVEEALAEVNARIVEIAPAHEGLRDYMGLNIKADTKAEIQASVNTYDHMLALMQNFVAAATSLLEANYPDLEPRAISGAAVADLQEQLDTITAARSKFFPVPEAVTVGITPGTPQDQ